MGENIEILNLSQLKEEGTIKYQNQIIIQQIFYKKSVSSRNEKNADTYV